MIGGVPTATVPYDFGKPTVNCYVCVVRMSFSALSGLSMDTPSALAYFVGFVWRRLSSDLGNVQEVKAKKSLVQTLAAALMPEEAVRTR
jgi:hypothetical protein